MKDLASSPLGINSTLTPEDYASANLSISDRRFVYSTLEQSLIFAVIYLGTVVFFVPTVYCNQRLGIHRTHAIASAVMVLATAMTPFATVCGVKALLVARLLAGIAFTNLFAVAGDVVARWAPAKERGLFVGIATSYIQLSCVVSMPLSGFLAERVGWPSVSYVHAAILAVLTALWILLYRDEPRSHPCISQEELALIVADMTPTVPSNSAPPYAKILSTPCIWGIYGACVGNFLIIQFGNTFLPLYLHTAFGYSTATAGMIGIAPMLLQFVFKLLTGCVTDRLSNLSDLTKVRWCNSIAFCGCAACLMVASAIPPSYPIAIITVVVASFGALGLNAGGFPKSGVLVARQFSSTVMSGVQLTLVTVMFVGSFFVPAMTRGGTADEYSHVFWLYAGLLVASNLVFEVLAKAEPASWTAC